MATRILLLFFLLMHFSCVFCASGLNIGMGDVAGGGDKCVKTKVVLHHSTSCPAIPTPRALPPPFPMTWSSHIRVLPSALRPS